VESYRKFVATIRSKYPKAEIICTLGNMDATSAGSPWPAYVRRAVLLCGDPKITTFFFEYKNAPGHPKVHEQRAMADALIHFIGKKYGW
jgi:hypothetical protein